MAPFDSCRAPPAGDHPGPVVDGRLDIGFALLDLRLEMSGPDDHFRISGVSYLEIAGDFPELGQNSFLGFFGDEHPRRSRTALPGVGREHARLPARPVPGRQEGRAAPTCRQARARAVTVSALWRMICRPTAVDPVKVTMSTA